MMVLNSLSNTDLKGYSIASTLEGQGVKVFKCNGENIDELYSAVCQAINTPGPVAVVSKRVMAPGIEGLEGSPHGHDVIPVDKAISYLKKRGYEKAEALLKGIKPSPVPYIYTGSTKEVGANRVIFGEAVRIVLFRGD